jgi:hypothetical protein
MKLLKFTEINSWEHETWNFYVWVDFETETRLRTDIEDAKKHGMCAYRLSDQEFDEDQVKSLESRPSYTTYMKQHNLCGVLHLPEQYDFKEHDPFYKGGIMDLCEPNMIKGY